MNPESTIPAMPGWRQQLVDYPSTSHFAQVDGYQMHYIDEGTGAPILMVHGNPTWSFYYRHLVNGLSDSYRTLAVDHIGCGLSQKPGDLPYSLDLRIDHLVRFVRELDLTGIHLVVHDWGGAIGLGAALEDLDRYRSFVILNTAAFPPPFFPLRIRVCRTPLLGRLALQGMNLFGRSAIRMATAQKGGLSADVRQGLLAPYDNWASRRAIYEFVADIPTRPSQPTWQRLAAIEKGLMRLGNHPVKLIWGMQDWCFRPQCLRKFMELIPHAEVRELPSAGHYVAEDASDVMTDEIREFLTGQP